MDRISHASAVSRFETVVTLQPGLDSNPEQRDLQHNRHGSDLLQA